MLFAPPTYKQYYFPYLVDSSHHIRAVTHGAVYPYYAYCVKAISVLSMR
jgi:hypothetical protein